MPRSSARLYQALHGLDLLPVAEIRSVEVGATSWLILDMRMAGEDVGHRIVHKDGDTIIFHYIVAYDCGRRSKV